MDRVRELGRRLWYLLNRRRLEAALVRPTFWTSAAGMLIGLAAGFPLGRALAGSPFYLNALDAWAYGLAAATALVARAVAAFRPAWRMLRADPLHALRHE
jgi:ABC-type antimicrobial peptide transport system permease subunit